MTLGHEPSDGPLGLEGRHQFKGGEQMPPGAGNETSLFMYGRHRPDLGDAWIKIDNIPGLHALGDADNFAEPAEGRIGDLFYPGEERGKTVIYEGRVVGQTLKDVRELGSIFRRVAAESRRQRLGSMTIVDPDNTGEGYALEQLRCTAFDMDDAQLRTDRAVYRWQRPFVLTVRIADPRAVWYPVAEDLGNANGATQVLTNLGNAPADLTFDVYSTGTGMDVILENLTTGYQLKFDDMPIPSGDLLRIDWGQRAAVWAEAANLPLYTPNTDMMPYLDHDLSDWWDQGVYGLGVGSNSIKVNGAGAWDVWFQHSAE